MCRSNVAPLRRKSALSLEMSGMWIGMYRAAA
jgi:hypothetical protein